MSYDPRSQSDGPPPDYAVAERKPVPDVTDVIQDIEGNSHASAQAQIGQALRAAMGIGALAMLPNLIEELQRSKDPDARLKFIQMALKEGGYGMKEDKHSSLPIFNFNFVGMGAPTKVEVVQQVEEAVATLPAASAALAALSSSINDDFEPVLGSAVKSVAEAVSPFDMIEGL
jgi:hypothetical protein